MKRTMDWHWWCIILCFCYVVKCFECPEGEGCSSCQTYSANTYEIACSTSTNGLVKIEISPNDFVKLTCHSSINWTNFHLGASNQIGSVPSLYLKMCELPETRRLDEIAKQLLIDEVENLHFVSYLNLGSSLSGDKLGKFSSVKRLTLSSNSFTEIPADFLHDFPQLTALDLRENKLRALPDYFFDSPTLESVELGDNFLETLQPKAFSRVDRLRLLNIWKNKLVTLMPGSFENALSLRTLNLRDNNLASLPRHIFSSLANLRTIYLSQNNFSLAGIPADLFRNCSGLEKIIFMENKKRLKTLPSMFLADLSNLTQVNMQKNGLEALPEDLFHGTTNLQYLMLSNNFLETLPRGIFNSTKKLLSLDLGFNEISSLPDDVFANLEELVKLDLSNNHIVHISEKLFSDLTSLHKLSMDMNNITDIHRNALRFLGELRIANFSHNALSLNSQLLESMGSPFPSSRSLEELYLEHNNISNIFDDWKHSTSLRVLNLAHNNLQSLKSTQLLFLSKNLSINLTYNNISYIDFDTRELTKMSHNRNTTSLIAIMIENNPIECDCRLYDLLRHLEGRLGPHMQKAFRLVPGNLTCSGPPQLVNLSIQAFDSKTLQCKMNDSDSANYKCPLPCSCYLKPDQKIFVVNCTKKGLSTAPKYLEVPKGHLVELHLNDNLLKSIPCMTRMGYETVYFLDISFNRISSVTADSIGPNLKILKLNNNLLKSLAPGFITALNSGKSFLRNISLFENPWKCDCDSRELQRVLRAKRTIINNLLEVKCNESGSPLFEMTPDELCRGLEVEWIIASCLIVALFGLIMGGLIGLCYRYQHEMKVWLYAKNWCLWWVTEDELDRDKLYDAFISYSHKDEEFVVNDLMPKLERSARTDSLTASKSFKLCVHFRDWPAGEWIPNQITRSVEQSRRTIVVLSPNFLESVWGRMEFRVAHSQALSQGRARVIVLLYGDIGSTDDLDSELKAQLSTNTCLKWGDPWFWEKLYYAMPHPPALMGKRMSAGNTTKKIFGSMKPPSPRALDVKDDKSELIIDQSVINGDPARSTIASNTQPDVTGPKIFKGDKHARQNDSPLSVSAQKFSIGRSDGKNFSPTKGTTLNGSSYHKHSATVDIPSFDINNINARINLLQQCTTV